MLKQYNNKFAVLLLTGALLSLPGCAKYKSQPLPVNTVSKVEKDGIQIGARQLSDKECHTYFSRRPSKKQLKAYQLIVNNKSNQSLTLDASDFGLELASRSHVINALELDPTPRAIGWGLTSVFLTPLFLIPTAVEWQRCKKANTQMELDFDKRLLARNEQVTIPAHTSINKLFFVDEQDLKNSLTAVVKNGTSGNSINFDVELT